MNITSEALKFTQTELLTFTQSFTTNDYNTTQNRMEGAFNITWSAFTENGQNVTVSTVNGTGIALYFDKKK